MMTPRENLKAVLGGGAPERMPVCMHLGANNLPGHLPRELLAEPLDRLKIGEYIGGDILYEIIAIRAKQDGGGETRTETHGDVRVTTLTTPSGSLTQEVLHSIVPTPVYAPLPAGHVLPGPIANSVHKSYFIKCLHDYRILRDCHENLTYAKDHDLILREQERVGEKGICILSGGPPSPLFALVNNYAGIEQVSFDLADDPGEVQSAMRAMTESACRWYRAAAASPCEAVRCTEDLDTKLISPDWFRRYSVPALAQYSGICHAAGKNFIVHMCGHIREFLPDIKSAGVDAIHCLTPPPMGNTTIEDARRILAGNTAAMLRMDANLMLRGSVAEIDRAVADIIDRLGDWHNALVIIPCGRAPLENLRRVVAQVRKRGQWSQNRPTT